VVGLDDVVKEFDRFREYVGYVGDPRRFVLELKDVVTRRTVELYERVSLPKISMATTRSSTATTATTKPTQTTHATTSVAMATVTTQQVSSTRSRSRGGVRRSNTKQNEALVVSSEVTPQMKTRLTESSVSSSGEGGGETTTTATSRSRGGTRRSSGGRSTSSFDPRFVFFGDDGVVYEFRVVDLSRSRRGTTKSSLNVTVNDIFIAMFS